MFGIKEFSAIINPPQTAILAVGAGREELGNFCEKLYKNFMDNTKLTFLATNNTFAMSCRFVINEGNENVSKTIIR